MPSFRFWPGVVAVVSFPLHFSPLYSCSFFLFRFVTFFFHFYSLFPFPFHCFVSLVSFILFGKAEVAPGLGRKKSFVCPIHGNKVCIPSQTLRFFLFHFPAVVVRCFPFSLSLPFFFRVIRVSQPIQTVDALCEFCLVFAGRIELQLNRMDRQEGNIKQRDSACQPRNSCCADCT